IKRLVAQPEALNEVAQEGRRLAVAVDHPPIRRAQRPARRVRPQPGPPGGRAVGPPDAAVQPVDRLKVGCTHGPDGHSALSLRWKATLWELHAKGVKVDNDTRRMSKCGLPGALWRTCVVLNACLQTPAVLILRAWGARRGRKLR